MLFKLRCACGESYWRRGRCDGPNSTACEITDEEGPNCPACGRDDQFEVVGEEDDSPTLDDQRAWGEV